MRAGGRDLDGILVRRVRAINPRDVTNHLCIPVTTPARTLVSLAAAVSAEELAYAFHEAGIRYDTTPEEVESVLARHPNAKGARKLRRVLHGDVKITASVLERKFLALLRRARLVLPETNIIAGGRVVDCRWPAHRLTVELDSYRYHRSRHAWELDRKRERQAYARGDQFRRYTWDDITKHQRATLRELRPLLG